MMLIMNIFLKETGIMIVNRLFLLCFFVLLLVACKTRKLDKLEGNWVQVNEVSSMPFGGITKYGFEIKNSKFKVVRHTVSDVSFSPPCNASSYDEFATGDVELKYKKLVFKGYYTDNLYLITDSLCFNTGKYYEMFDYKFNDDNLILKINNSEFIFIKQ